VGLEPSRAQPLNPARFNEPDLTDAEWAVIEPLIVSREEDRLFSEGKLISYPPFRAERRRGRRERSWDE